MTNAGDSGIVVIKWKNTGDCRVKQLIEDLYNKNTGTIDHMLYYEIGKDAVDVVNTIVSSLENLNAPPCKEVKPQRKEKSLTAFFGEI